MWQPTDDLRIAELRPLLPPAILLEEIPLTEEVATTVVAARQAAGRIVHGADDRLLVVVGPCSIHDPKAALEYAELLRKARGRFGGELELVMRVYFEKPRTTLGWKGFINDPDLDGSCKINKGLRAARQLLADLGRMAVPAATEFVDTITPQFIADLVSWAAIGARTTESPVHRQLASGLSMPVGFKNGTDGNVQIAVDAIRAVRAPHSFLSVTKQGIAAIVSTRGNDTCHIVLRGAHGGPNYGPEHVATAARALTQSGLDAAVMIDLSHGNSQKDFARQPVVAEAVAAQVAAGSRTIVGVMIESHLVAGRQELTSGAALVHGQSITDACLDWASTAPVLEVLARAVSERRAVAGKGA